MCCAISIYITSEMFNYYIGLAAHKTKGKLNTMLQIRFNLSVRLWLDLSSLYPSVTQLLPNTMTNKAIFLPIVNYVGLNFEDRFLLLMRSIVADYFKTATTIVCWFQLEKKNVSPMKTVICFEINNCLTFLILLLVHWHLVVGARG